MIERPIRRSRGGLSAQDTLVNESAVGASLPSCAPAVDSCFWRGLTFALALALPLDAALAYLGWLLA